MTIHPVVPVVLLIALGVLLIGAQVAALRRGPRTGRNRLALWRWAGVTAAGILLLVAAVRVVIVTDDQAATRVAGDSEPNVFIVIDRSPDMAVRDIGDRTRMDQARDDITALIARYPRARVAVIGFASAPSLDWPLSADTWSLRPLLETLAPYPYGHDAVAEANAGAADIVLRYQLISAGQQYPRAQNLVFYLGAGAPESQSPARQFDLSGATVHGGAVLGYGTATGGPIPGTDVDQSPVNEQVLQTVAEQLKVPYVGRADTEALATVLPDDDAKAGRSAALSAAAGQTETYWLPAIGAAVLILVELFFVLRDLHRTSPGGRRLVEQGAVR